MGPKRAVRKKAPARATPVRTQVRTQGRTQGRTQDLFNEAALERFGRTFGITPEQVRVEMDLDDVPLADRPNAFETPSISQNLGERQEGTPHEGSFSDPQYNIDQRESAPTPASAPAKAVNRTRFGPADPAPSADREPRNKPYCIHCIRARKACWGGIPCSRCRGMGRDSFQECQYKEGVPFKKEDDEGDGGGKNSEGTSEIGHDVFGRLGEGLAFIRTVIG